MTTSDARKRNHPAPSPAELLDGHREDWGDYGYRGCDGCDWEPYEDNGLNVGYNAHLVAILQTAGHITNP